MPTVRSGIVLALEPGIVLHSLPNQDRFYAFSVISGNQFRLNRTSFWVLEKISTGIEWSKLRDYFLETFEVPSEQGESELKSLVDELCSQTIVRRNGDEKDKV